MAATVPPLLLPRLLLAGVWHMCLCGSRPALALPALVPCEAAARAGRWGLCSAAHTDGTAAASEPVVLRGSNYIRLGGNLTSGCVGYHSTFDEGEYNRTRFLDAFRTMQAQQFNIMRVFIDARPGCGIGGDASSTEPLDARWLDRLAQFITDAEGHGMYTLVTLNRPVNNAYFQKLAEKVPLPPEWEKAGGWNVPFMTKRGHAAFATYGSVLAAGLRARLAPAAQRGAGLARERILPAG
jgi:hypothetical protein